MPSDTALRGCTTFGVVHPSVRKGDIAEREAAALLGELLGYTIERKGRGGSQRDTGDLVGLPDTVVQVSNAPADTLRKVHTKPLDAELQRERAGATFAATMIRLRGGTWRVVLTPEQFATLWREATA